MHERTVRARTTAGTVEGFTRDGVNRWRSIPYARPPVGRCASARRSPHSPGPGCGTATASPTARPSSAATPCSGVGQIPADERGLPDPQRRHARSRRSRTAAGHGLHPRRRIHPGQFGHPALRRRRAGPPRLRVRVGQLPAGRAGLLGPVVAVHPGHHHRQQPVSARPGPGAALGQGQHRRIRR